MTSTRHSAQRTQKLLLRDLLERAFGGSAPKPVLGVLPAKSVSADELAQIRKILDTIEGDTP